MAYKNTMSKRAADHKQRLYERGLCTWCGNPRDNQNGRLCSNCQSKNNALVGKLQYNRLANGLCKKCNSSRMEGSNLYCTKHWFQKICIDRTGTVKCWQVIADKFEQQNHRCPYSGKELILCDNAQLDHKIPVTLGGTNEPDNLEWIDAEINRMKGKRTKNEFIQLCQLISCRID